MLHVDLGSLLVHPSLTYVRVEVQVAGVFVAWKRGLIRSGVRPQLITLWMIRLVRMKVRSDKVVSNAYPRRLNHPFLLSSIGTGLGHTKLSSHLTFLVETDINLGLTVGVGPIVEALGSLDDTESWRDTNARLCSGGDRVVGGERARGEVEVENESRRGRCGVGGGGGGK